MTPLSHLHLLCLLLHFSCCLITQTQSFTPSKSTSVPLPTHHPLRTPFYTVKFNTHDEATMSQHRSSFNTKLHLLPELSSSSSSSIFLSSETESWRQYVPLVVSVGVIIDILLGSPLANLALGPMKRASEKGATGGNSEEGSDNGGEGGGSLFSSFGGKGRNVVDKSKERVDSEAIAQAALDKAMYTLELKRFLEENKTDEQRYEDVRKKIERQMDDLDNAM
mmetsp:Transcript_4117/g.6199  ORF Transcript_4117/g.6199 Transcript_4117/m.6199 type:complete len:222 (-) Transcript_4117:144-809(-)